jgi:hypothetical protein
MSRSIQFDREVSAAGSARNRRARTALAVLCAMLLGACATAPSADYTAFRAARPASLLIMPPVNDSPEVNASVGVMATATLPLAEAGYYVLPVSLVQETFRQNGMSSPAEIQNVATVRLREIFGADAAVYIRVKDYGTKYLVFGSDTRVTVEGRIVDLRSGQQLWVGTATASSTEGDSNNSGIVGLLVKAIVQQIVGTVTDASFNYAGVANTRLLGAPAKNGVLFGPRSPNYLKD